MTGETGEQDVDILNNGNGSLGIPFMVINPLGRTNTSPRYYYFTTVCASVRGPRLVNETTSKYSVASCGR